MNKYIGLLGIFLVLGFALSACAPSPSETPQSTESQPVVQEQPQAAQPAEKPAVQEKPAETAPAQEQPAVAMGDPNTWEGWFVDKAEWVRSAKEFDKRTEQGVLPGDASALRVNASVGDDRVRDLYLARTVDGLEAGKTYKISLDYKFDTPTPGAKVDFPDADSYVAQQKVKTSNYIQYATIDGKSANHDAIAEIEDYPDHDRPNTQYADPAAFGDGQAHKLEFTHKLGEGQTSMTFAMIVRFRAKNRSDNWFWFGNFKVEEAPAAAPQQ